MSSEQGSTANPYAATTLEMSPDPWTATASVTIGQRRALMGLGYLLAIGLAAAWIQIESILFSGPILFLLGVYLSFVAFRSNHTHLMAADQQSRLRLIALLCLAFPILCLLTIVGFSWGPSQAARPVGWMCVAFALACWALVFRAIRAKPISEDSAKQHQPET